MKVRRGIIRIRLVIFIIFSLQKNSRVEERIMKMMRSGEGIPDQSK